MKEFRIRTEDFKGSELGNYFVPSDIEETILDRLCGREPILLIGSRGVGKSFLLRLSEYRLGESFEEDRVLPVYVSFSRLTLLHAAHIHDFRAWMLAKICAKIGRALAEHGISSPKSHLSILRLGSGGASGQSLEAMTERLEMAWKGPGPSLVTDDVPSVEQVRDILEDVCEGNNIDRVVLFVDEAAHAFVPAHQRQFFTLMRDLRSPYLAVKAAVYPGTTAYGDSFEPSHDASIITLDRDPTDPSYLDQMRRIVEKQDADWGKRIDKNPKLFSSLAIAASGNPRTLLKTLARSQKMQTKEVIEVVRQFYREEIWSEHSSLSARYPGHRVLIDWGREFLEAVVKALGDRNREAVEKSAYFWVHRDAPAGVAEGLRLLAYSGLVRESGSGIRATRRELGTRYMVNVGCLLAVESDSVAVAESLLADLSVKRMIEFGRNHAHFEPVARIDVAAIADLGAEALERLLAQSIDKLDLSEFQMQSLRSVGLTSIGLVLQAQESDIQKAPLVGPVRARQMMNAAQSAVLEYLSG